MQRRYLTLAILFVSAVALSGQTNNWGDPGSVWAFQVGSFNSLDINKLSFTSMGDTVIQGVTARIIHKEHDTCNGNSGAYYLYENHDTLYQFIPERDSFEMILDFGAEVGDTWTLMFNEQLAVIATDWVVRVDSISYLHTPDGDSLRVQHTTITSRYPDLWGEYPSAPYSRIIEHVGYDLAVMPQTSLVSLCDWRSESELLCYESPAVGNFYFTASQSCDLISALSDAPQPQGLRVYPNPSSGFVTVLANSGAYAITNMAGQPVQRGEVIDAQPIAIDHLAPGIYFLHLSDGTAAVRVSKFIKQ